MVGQALDAFGGLDILMNNAGVSKRQSFDEISAEDYRNIIALNLDSTFFMVRKVWAYMKAQRYGPIVHTGSGTGMFGTKNNAHYGAAKGGIYGPMRVLGIDAAPFGIKINSVTPMAATRPPITFRMRISNASSSQPCLRSAALQSWAGWAHESCSVNGEVFDIGVSVVSRILTGLTQRYLNLDMTIEDVAANLDTIMEEAGYSVPRATRNCAEGKLSP